MREVTVRRWTLSVALAGLACVGAWLQAAPPGAVVDTTGAGDAFLGGILTGLLRGKSPADAGRLGAAAGACCVTGLGATTAIHGYEETARLAGVA